LQPENNRPPHKGVHVFHVLVIFPVEQEPWESHLNWMRTSANPFPRGSWIVCSGRLLGVLDRNLIQGPQLADPSVRILVILPDNCEIVRQSTLSANNRSAPTPSNHVNRSPTTPRPAGPGVITSRNPFSSPLRRQEFSSLETASPPKSTTEQSDAVPTIASSGFVPPLPCQWLG
jgi:hypothetical protein